MRGRPAGSIRLLSDKEIASICLECTLPSRACSRLRCSRFNSIVRTLRKQKLKELEKQNDNKQ